MLDTSSLVDNISFILVFIAGITSFFSPCIIPILPVYLGYLSGSDTYGEYNTKKVLVNTIAFVLGISVVFFLLGFAFTNLGQFLNTNQNIITKISGIIVIVFGLIQLDFVQFKFLNRERRINKDFDRKKMNPFSAFVMGLTFSFAWTPCVGPILSSVLLLASSSKSMVLGNVLVLVYTLGFIIPFILAGIFTTKILNLINKRKNIMKFVKKFGGALLIVIGIMMYTGWLNTFSGYLNSIVPNTTQAGEPETVVTDDEKVEPEVVEPEVVEEESSNQEVQTDELPEIVDFTLVDQQGTEHTLSSYEGKVVFLNFWATGCPPCKNEIPRIEQLYKENTNENVEIITVVNPHGFLEQDEDYIKSFIKDNGITFPVLFDDTGDVFNSYGISSIPTTFMITADGKIFGYVSGELQKDVMMNIIDQTLDHSGLK